MLDVSVKMEITDFLQPIIKQKLQENIITPEKCVIGIGYVQTQSPLFEVNYGSSWVYPRTYLEMGVLPIEYGIDIRRLRFLWTILQKNNDDPVRMVYTEMLKYRFEED